MLLRRLCFVVPLVTVFPACNGSDGHASDPGRPDASPDGAAPDALPPAPDASRSDGGASPVITGPITAGSHGSFNPLPPSLKTRYGYTEDEFFLEGTAQAYAMEGAWSGDGRWTAAPATTDTYKTRVLVRRPTDPSKFNGTVFVEWLNVSAGVDADADFGLLHVELLRSGFVYVGVSAQAVGVQGGGGILPVPIPVQPLKEWDPERYGTLHHPGDDYSYDIFSQVGAALRHPGGVDLLSGLHAQHVIGAGESQSAFRMVTYVNAVHPVSHVYDGFLIHSRGGGGAPIAQASATSQPPTTIIRTDLSEPVFQFETETDLFFLGYMPARQPDSDRIVSWEVAGTSHADQSTLDYGLESGAGSLPDGGPDLTIGCGEINTGPQRFVLRKAVAALRSWVEGGEAPSSADPLETSDARTIARDAHGNALGGVRTPPVDVPIAALSGEQSSGSSIFCSLFGSTIPFDPATLASLYPTHQDYVAAYTAAARAAVDAGHLLQADADEMVQEATSAAIP